MERTFSNGAASALIAAAITGCSPARPTPDAMLEDLGTLQDRGPRNDDVADVRPDRGVTDSAVMDAGGPDVLDVVIPMFEIATPLDVHVPDVVIEDGGACHAVGPPTAFGGESTVLSRGVTVTAEFTGFASAATVDREGAENVWLHRVTRDGVITATGNVSQVPAGRQVRGGTYAPEGELYVLAFTSNITGKQEVYVRRAQSNAVGFGNTLQVSRDADPVETPQLVPRMGGFLVAWRSVGSTGARLRIAATDFSLATVSAAIDISETDANVTTLRLVGSPDDMLFAIAYRLERAGGQEIRVQPLNNDGTTMGTAIAVAAGTDLGDGIDMVARARDTVVTWTQPRSAPTLRVRRIGVLTGGVGTSVATELTGAPMPAAQPGIALDGDGYAIGYRAGDTGSLRLAMARVRADFTLRDASVLSGAAPGGSVGIAARTSPRFGSDNRYGLGWADDFATGTVSRLLVIECP